MDEFGGRSLASAESGAFRVAQSLSDLEWRTPSRNQHLPACQSVCHKQVTVTVTRWCDIGVTVILMAPLSFGGPRADLRHIVLLRAESSQVAAH
jgi:hypothetical protein